MFNQNAEYAFNLPCRRLAAVAPSSSTTQSNNPSKSAASSFDEEDYSGDDYLDDTASSSNRHRFLVGTAFPSVSKFSENASDGDNNDNNLSIIEEDDENRTNRIYSLQYHEDSNELSLETSFVHPMGEIWSMACHPKKADWVATCGGGAIFSPIGEEKKDNDRLAHFQTTLWKIPDYSNADDDGEDNDDFNDTTISKNNSLSDNDDFWSENNNTNQDANRNRTASGVSLTSGSKLEPVLKIPHGQNNNVSSSTTSGWEQRVGQILWNPLLYPNSSSGDAFVDLAETSSHEGGGNLITVGWDARSPITLWDISSMSEAKEVWSTNNNAGSSVNSSFNRGRGRLDRFSGLASALPRRVSWDPHETNHILATAGVDVVAYDMRCPPREVGVIRSAHRYGVTDVCHNHLQSNVVVTSGMDGIVKFFDLRMHMSQRSSSNSYLDTSTDDAQVDSYTQPTLLKAVRGGHSHWAIRAAYNPFYDQLVLSGGTDAIANLWRISSCSSAPLLDLGGDEDEDVMTESDYGNYGEDGGKDVAAFDDQEEGNEEEDMWNKENDQTSHSGDEEEGVSGDRLKRKSLTDESSSTPDIKVTRFECSDVTTDITWSASDPWVYATLSCDGGLVVHHVPRKEKYKILL